MEKFVLSASNLFLIARDMGKVKFQGTSLDPQVEVTITSKGKEVVVTPKPIKIKKGED